MDKEAEDLLRKLQNRFEKEYAVNLHYGSINQDNRNNWVISLNSRDGNISVEGIGGTDVDAVKDAFAKAEKQFSELSAPREQQQAGGFSVGDISGSPVNISGSPINIGNKSASGVPGGDIVGGDETTSTAPVFTSKEQQPTEPERGFGKGIDDSFAKGNAPSPSSSSSEQPLSESDIPPEESEGQAESKIQEEVPADRLPQYLADDTSGEDLLDIDNDVDALASLITARSTIPPLSVGIFGDWGSGKTFFMRQLIRRVNKISRRARKSDQPQNKIAFYKYIAQIEFNAWHYVEGNLWASLVEHILSNLRIADDDQPDIIEARQKELLSQLEIETLALDQATREEERIQSVVTEAEGELTEIVGELEREQRNLTAAQLSPVEIIRTIQLEEPVKAQIKQLMNSIGLSETVESAQDFYDAVRKMQSVLAQGNSVLMPLARAEDKRSRIIILGVILGSSFLVGLLVSWLTTTWGDSLSQYSGLASGAATLLGTGAAWLRNQADWFSSQIEKVEDANQTIEKLLADKKSEYDRKIAEAQQKIDHLNAQYAAARRKKDQAEQRVTEIKIELAELSPAQQLGKFLQDRIASDDYRKHLGLLALIRRDFEKLSNFIDAQNKNVESDQETPEDQCINRIILYIDDLDRCPPERVVQVLQAVHLLLAFPLFVVVVGVDARWVSQSLESSYKELLQKEEAESSSNGIKSISREATPHDYLEKIFQIPLWIKPVGEAGSRNMLHKLLQSSLVSDENGSADQDQELQGDEISDEDIAQQGDDQQAADDQDQPETGSHHLGPEELNRFLNPISLTIHKNELKFMEQLAPLLGRSPRAVKRFINIYRLVKISLDDFEQTDFTKGETVEDYQVVMFLLSILTGMPSISRQFFEAMTNNLANDEAEIKKPEKIDKNLSGLLTKLQDQTLSTTGRRDLDRLEQWVNDYGEGEWKLVPLETLAALAPQVGRYSFRVGQA